MLIINIIKFVMEMVEMVVVVELMKMLGVVLVEFEVMQDRFILVLL